VVARVPIPLLGGATEWLNSQPLGRRAAGPPSRRDCQAGSTPDEASAAAGRYMAEAKGIVGAPDG
jgi:hypothetical protein